MHKRRIVIVASLLLTVSSFLTEGCQHITWLNTGRGSDRTATKDTSFSTCWWGFFSDKYANLPDAAVCHGNPFAKIEITEGNAWTIVTLGFYTPTTVHCECAVDDDNSGHPPH
jgi:hypothetical protein